VARWETFPSEVTAAGWKGGASRTRSLLAMACLLASGPVVAAGLPAGRPVPCEGAIDAPPALPAADGAPKFALFAATCGSSAVPVAAAKASPRIAAQLALYADAEAAPAPAEPVTAAAAPTKAPTAPAPRPRGAGPEPRRPSAAAVQRIRALAPAVEDVARRYGIDPLLLHAVAHVESRHQADARSHAGARGVMQVMPATARRFGLDDPARELLQPELNLQVGAEYLKTLQARFGNNLPLVLAAYNAGEGAVEKHGRRIPPYPETQAYVRDVLATYAELRRRLLGAPTGIAGSV